MSATYPGIDGMRWEHTVDSIVMPAEFSGNHLQFSAMPERGVKASQNRQQGQVLQHT